MNDHAETIREFIIAQEEPSDFALDAVSRMEREIAALRLQLSAAQQEVAKMDAVVRVVVPELIERLTSTCVWCGTPAPDALSAEALRSNIRDHLAVCPEHPMRALEAERDAALADNVELAQAVRLVWEFNKERKDPAHEWGNEIYFRVTRAVGAAHPGATLLEQHQQEIASWMENVASAEAEARTERQMRLDRDSQHSAALDEAVAKERAYRDQRIKETAARARNEWLEKAAQAAGDAAAAWADKHGGINAETGPRIAAICKAIRDMMEPKA